MSDSTSPQEKVPPLGARVFISYKRNAEPDVSVALKVYEELKGLRHHVFIDQLMPVGSLWADRIDKELRQADFLIALLSAESIQSEMVIAEIETAFRLAKETRKRPLILPVRLAYRAPLRYPLNAYLNHLNSTSWETPEDTPRLIKELLHVISGGVLQSNTPPQFNPPEVVETLLPAPLPSVQPAQLEPPDDGTMDPQSAFYVERKDDKAAIETIQRQGVTLIIKAPRQMGKSSLLTRVIDKARKAGKQVAVIDFQLFDKPALAEASVFFKQFCTLISDALGINDRVDDFWRAPLGNSHCCTRYVGNYLLKETDKPLVLAMDEVERVFETSYRTDFFGMLRSWHNSRAITPIWKKVDLALVTSTEPYQFIKDLNQSPFNVGKVLELADFSSEQLSDLNRRHGAPLNLEQEGDLMALVGGHPYLVRRALYLVASGSLSADDLFAHAAEDYGPFGDHLRRHLFGLSSDKELLNSLTRIIQHETCQDEQVYFRLHGAGLVVRADRHRVVPRCRLYADFFRERLNV